MPEGNVEVQLVRLRGCGSQEIQFIVPHQGVAVGNASFVGDMLHCIGAEIHHVQIIPPEAIQIPRFIGIGGRAVACLMTPDGLVRRIIPGNIFNQAVFFAYENGFAEKQSDSVEEPTAPLGLDRHFALNQRRPEAVPVGKILRFGKDDAGDR